MIASQRYKMDVVKLLQGAASQQAAKREEQANLLVDPAVVLLRLQALQQSRAALLPSCSPEDEDRPGVCAKALLAEARRLAQMWGAWREEEEKGGGSASWVEMGGEMATAASEFDAVRKTISSLAAGPSPPGDEELLAQAIAQRGRAAECLQATCSQILQVLRPSVEQRSQRKAQIQSVIERTQRLLAHLPAPADILDGIDPETCELPVLAEGAGSSTEALQQGWEIYHAARERETASELLVQQKKGLWEAVDGAALAQWQRDTSARKDAVRALYPLMLAVEEEHRVLLAQTVVLGHALALWCHREVEAMQTALAQQESLAESTYARAEALLGTAVEFLKAQVCADHCVWRSTLREGAG